MNTVWVSHSRFGQTNTIKAVIDKDCLPCECVKITEFVTTADFRTKRDRSERFWHHYDKMKWLENLDFVICLDFGDYFYETGMNHPHIREYQAGERVQ